jgi:hypothetical protein
MSADIVDAVQALARESTRGFRASAVARRAHSPVDEVRQQLMQMVEHGQLELKFQLICPDNGRTICTFDAADELPLGKEMTDQRCETDEPFVVDKSTIWVTFKPTVELFRAANKELAAELDENLKKKNQASCSGTRCPQGPTPSPRTRSWGW